MATRKIAVIIAALLICCLIIGLFLGSRSFFTQKKSDAEGEPEAAKVQEAEKTQEEFGHLTLDKTWTGDFDGMVERRLVRALVVFNKMQFFIDQGRYRGVSVEMLEAFGRAINKGNQDKALHIDLIFLPVYRDQLIPALVEGKGDIAVGNLTISEGRLEHVDFSEPFLTGVKEIVIANYTFLGRYGEQVS